MVDGTAHDLLAKASMAAGTGRCSLKSESNFLRDSLAVFLCKLREQFSHPFAAIDDLDGTSYGRDGLLARIDAQGVAERAE